MPGPFLASRGGSVLESAEVPDVSAETSALILEVLRKTPTTEVPVPDSPAKAASDSGSVADRANTLLDEFVRQALAGNPHVCTYAWAYRRLVDASYRKWSQAYSNQIINVARRTPLRELRGLGSVCLDAFVVASASGQPSAGHWRTAPYDREDWERVLGSAVILE